MVAVALIAEGVRFDRAREEAGRERAAATAVASQISAGDERLALAARLAAETGDPQWARLLAS
ncbi:MAG: hypothetical protein M3Q08_01300 [Pseudomonadota bacterium]|nr:hypothetical protein [Pseudomonadota bacterium]